MNDGFTPAQQAAITAGDGPLGIIAGPGCGKTTALAARIAHLVRERGADPSSILVVTFTAEAARRLRHEVGRQLDTRAADLAIHTLHAFGRKVIDTWPGKFGFLSSPTVVHRDEAHDLLARAAAQLGWDLSSVTPNELASAVDRYRLSDDAAAAVASDPDDALGALAASYEEQLQRRGAIDFPAMLSWPLRLLRQDAQVRHVLQSAFRWVVVDEVPGPHADPAGAGAAARRGARKPDCRWRSAADASFAGSEPIRPFCSTSPACTPAPRWSPWSTITVRPRTWLGSPTRSATCSSNRRAWSPTIRPDRWRGWWRPKTPRPRPSSSHTRSARSSTAGCSITRAIPPCSIAPTLRRMCSPLRCAPLAFRIACTRTPICSVSAWCAILSPICGSPTIRLIGQHSAVSPIGRDAGLARLQATLLAEPTTVAELPALASQFEPQVMAAAATLAALVYQLHAAACRGTSPARLLDQVLEASGYGVWLERRPDRVVQLEVVRRFRAVMQRAEVSLGEWLDALAMGEEVDVAAQHEATQLCSIHQSKGKEWRAVFLTRRRRRVRPALPRAAG